jgi:hypothetical protein
MERRSLDRSGVNGLEQWKKDNPFRGKRATPRRTFLGYGIGYIGKKPVRSASKQSGRFITTRFIVLNRLTVIPVGSYVATEGRDGYPKAQERVNLQWDQVWEGTRLFLLAIAVGCLLAALSIAFGKRH